MVEEQKTAAGGENEELLTLVEAINILGISKPTIYRLLDRGDLKGLKVGNQWRFRKADLSTYLGRDTLAVTSASVPNDVLDEELAFFSAQLEKPVPEFAADADLPTQKTVALVSGIVELALQMHASDIHLEISRLDGENISLLRFRVDGVLHEIRRLSGYVHNAIISRFKEMTGMSLEEKRVPQDGRIECKQKGKQVSIRVNISPMLLGEALVACMLDQGTTQPRLEQIGFRAEELVKLKAIISQPHGIVLLTGPTGSGKITTLYACLLEVARPEVKTLTIEDPVEFLIPWATQAAVNVKNGYTFISALRSFMRQDPDVIMLGEIRDGEMANACFQAAITGHMVFSSLPTNNAVATLVRLLDMGVEPYLITASATVVVSQRLVRRLCDACKTPANHSKDELIQLGLTYAEVEDATFYEPVGCNECHQMGYRGRIACHEILQVNDALTGLLAKRATEEEITRVAVAHGMTTLLRDGLLKARDGATSIAEILRVVKS